MPLTKPQHEIFTDPTRFRVIVAGRRFGKALEVDTEIPTPNGFVKIKDISVGDFVYSPNGQAIKVVSHSGIFVPEKAYKLYFSDGSSIICDSNHEWFTYTKLDRKYLARGKANPSVKTTQEIVDTIKHNGESNHAIPVANAVENGNKNLPIDPYIFGQWLGDGTSRGEFIENLTKVLDRHNGKFTKEIPSIYQFSSYEQRLALLQGLMDSDGHATKKLNQCEFTSSSEKLAKDVNSLVCSLGMKPTIREYNSKIGGRVVGKRYRVFFHATVPCFRLDRKLVRLKLDKPSTNYSKFRYITSYEEVYDVEVCCIQVDSDDHLYLASENYIATHNSILCLNELTRAAQVAKNQSVYYVAPTLKMARRILWPLLKAAIPKQNISSKNEQDMAITLKGYNSTIFLCGADNEDSLRGISISFLVVDEMQDIPISTIDMILRPAMGDQMADGVFIGTPKGKGDNTAYLLYLRGKNPNFPDWESWHYTTAEGGNVSEEEIAAAKAVMSAKAFQQEYEASFITMQGRVYHAFDIEKNVSLDVVDRGGDIHIGMDFNVSPMTAVIGQKVGKNKLEIFDEISIQDSNTEEICSEIKARYPNRRITIYPDASGDGRSTKAPIGQTDHTIMKDPKYGFCFSVVAPAKNPPIVDRVNDVNAILCSADGERNLLINPKCENLIKCLDGQTYKEGTSIPDKSQGLDHANDALGYLVSSQFSIIKRSVTILTLDYTY